jgi:hypothetical protein
MLNVFCCANAVPVSNMTDVAASSAILARLVFNASSSSADRLFLP